MAGGPADHPRNDMPSPHAARAPFNDGAQRPSAASDAFTKQYKSRVEKLTPEEFLQALRQFEKLAAVPSAAPAFFAAEIQALDEALLIEKMAAPGMAHFAPFLAQLRRDKDHVLSAPAAAYQQQMREVTLDAWHRLYDQQRAMPAGSAKSGTLILNTLVELKAVDDRARDFDTAENSQLHALRLTPETLETILKAAKSSYAATSQRFQPQKNAAATVYSGVENAEIMLAAFGKFSPALADYAAGKLGETGTAADVLARANALGQEFHRSLAETQTPLYKNIPPLLNGAFGVFAEALVADELLARGATVDLRDAITARRIAALQSPAALFTFERRLHAERAEKGEAGEARIDTLWAEAMRDLKGRKDNLPDWREAESIFKAPLQSLDTLCAGGIGHGLAVLWRDSKDPAVFAAQLSDMLKAGSAVNPAAALAVLGADIDNAAFWKKSFAQSAQHLNPAAKPLPFNAAAVNDNTRKEKPLLRPKRQEPKP